MLSKIAFARTAGAARARLWLRRSRRPQQAQAGEGYWQGVQKAGVLRCGAAVAPALCDARSGNRASIPASSPTSAGNSPRCSKVKPEFVDTTWDNIVAGLQAGKWDLSLALNRTPVARHGGAILDPGDGVPDLARLQQRQPEDPGGRRRRSPTSTSRA